MCDQAGPSNGMPKWSRTRWGRRLAKTVWVNNEPRLNPSLLAHGLLIFGVLIGGTTLYVSALASIFSLSDEWRVCSAINSVEITGHSKGIPDTLPNLRTVFANIDSLGTSKSASPILQSQKDRLKEQLKQLDIAQRRACTVSIFFFANRNAALTVSTAMGILAITSLAVVSKKGWDDTNNAIINIGISSGLLLFSMWTFSQLYGQEINYESNSSKQTLASDLINSVASAAANRSAIGYPEADRTSKPDPIDLDTSTGMTTLIRALDGKLLLLNKMEFTGDTSFAESSARRISNLMNSTGKEPQVSPAPAKP